LGFETCELISIQFFIFAEGGTRVHTLYSWVDFYLYLQNKQLDSDIKVVVSSIRTLIVLYLKNSS
jgi:hypothetical protein